MVIQSAGPLSPLTVTSVPQATTPALSAWHDALAQAGSAPGPAATSNQDKGQGPAAAKPVAGAASPPATPTTAPSSAPAQGVEATTVVPAPAPGGPQHAILAVADAATGPAEPPSRLDKARAAVSRAESDQNVPDKTHKAAAAAIPAVASAPVSADLPVVSSIMPSSGGAVPSADPCSDPRSARGVTLTATEPGPVQGLAVAPSAMPPLPVASAKSPEPAVTSPQGQAQVVPAPIESLAAALPEPVAAPATPSPTAAAPASVSGQASNAPLSRPSAAQNPGAITRPAPAPSSSLPADRTAARQTPAAPPAPISAATPTAAPRSAPVSDTATASVAPGGIVAAAPSSPTTAAVASSSAGQPRVTPIARAAVPAPIAAVAQTSGQSDVSGETAVASPPPASASGHDQGAGPAATDPPRAAAVVATQPRDDRQTNSINLANTSSSGLGSGAALGGAASPAPAGITSGQTVSAALPAAASTQRSASGDGAVPPTPTALAATVVAMTGSGHSSTVLRLAPPDLGTLSIHVAYAADASVNVVFVPSTSQTAQLLSGGMEGLRHAMATAGLTLGQAQIGGGTGGGGQAAGGGDGRFSGQRQSAGAQTGQSVAAPPSGTMPDGQGARAIA